MEVKACSSYRRRWQKQFILKCLQKPEIRLFVLFRRDRVFPVKSCIARALIERDQLLTTLLDNSSEPSRACDGGMIGPIRENFTDAVGLTCRQTTWYFWGTDHAATYKHRRIYDGQLVKIVFSNLEETVEDLVFQCLN